MLNYKMPSVSQILFNCPRANLKSLWSKWMNTKFINKTAMFFRFKKKSPIYVLSPSLQVISDGFNGNTYFMLCYTENLFNGSILKVVISSHASIL